MFRIILFLTLVLTPCLHAKGMPPRPWAKAAEQKLPPAEPCVDYTPVVVPNGSKAPFKIKDGVKIFHLTIEETVWEIAKGLKANVWGVNLSRLFSRLFPNKKVHTFFQPGNCGMEGRAKRNFEGDYVISRYPSENEKMKYGDPVNSLACFPGQYGVGIWSQYPTRNWSVISRLKWKSFNPHANLQNYRNNKGNDFIPDHVTLFDKCLMKFQFFYKEKWIHFVALHATPAYDFEIPQNINVPRNRDQMAFLEWLLTGHTYFSPQNILDDTGKKVLPLPPDEPVIVTGDFNLDFRKKEIPGAKHLNNILLHKKFDYFPKGQPTFKSEENELQLDYMIWSTHFKAVKQKLGRIDPESLSDHSPLYVELAQSSSCAIV